MVFLKVNDTTPRVKPNVNYGIWAMMCHCRVIAFNKCTRLAGDADSWGSHACIGAGSIG